MSTKGSPCDAVTRESRRGGNAGQEEGAPMDVLGDLSDSPIVVVMFLVGVVTWFLRDKCETIIF